MTGASSSGRMSGGAFSISRLTRSSAASRCDEISASQHGSSEWNLREQAVRGSSAGGVSARLFRPRRSSVRLLPGLTLPLAGGVERDLLGLAGPSSTAGASISGPTKRDPTRRYIAYAPHDPHLRTAPLGAASQAAAQRLTAVTGSNFAHSFPRSSAAESAQHPGPGAHLLLLPGVLALSWQTGCSASAGGQPRVPARRVVTPVPCADQNIRGADTAHPEEEPAEPRGTPHGVACC